jgi:transglutaminase-like putative cysteine protease
MSTRRLARHSLELHDAPAPAGWYSGETARRERMHDATVLLLGPAGAGEFVWQLAASLDKLNVTMSTATASELLRPTETIESGHPDVVSFARGQIGDTRQDIDQAVRLYYAVRDSIRYDPYQIDLTPAGMKASTTLQTRRGWCVSKAVLLAACCRSVGIPARLGFADVRNHLSTERLREKMGTDIYYWHGYTDMQLDGKWVKATPAFNIELCRKFRLLPLEFDGLTDSLYHPFDEEGNRHMEYVRQRGAYTDLPIDEIARTFHEEYRFARPQSELALESFDEDVERETRR